MYPEQFDRVGNVPGDSHITIDSRYTPVVHAARKFPDRLQEKLITEIKCLENLGIIKISSYLP